MDEWLEGENGRNEVFDDLGAKTADRFANGSDLRRAELAQWWFEANWLLG
jgi:hypothetical protein